MIIGSLIELVNGMLVAGIGIAMFPVLKRHSASIALGYAGFRIVEFVTHVVNINSSLPLLSLSQGDVGGGAADVSRLQALGDLILAQRDWVRPH